MLGVWIIGVCGSVASATIAAVKALAKRLIEPTGLITELDDFSKVGFIPFDSIVFGGCDVRDGSVTDSFSRLTKEAHIDSNILKEVASELDRIEIDREGCTTLGCSERVIELAESGEERSLEEIVTAIVNAITNFKERNSLERVLVLYLASTEPPIKKSYATQTLKGFEDALEKNEKGLLHASNLYAYASFLAGCPFINFTPSSGASIPALIDMAEKRRLPHTGNDGKTGETLVKSVLAPLFKYRALKLLSWQGYNILGNLDGKVLIDPESKTSKTKTKEGLLQKIVGYAPHMRVGIDYVPSLGEWKVAWDFIHFEGLFGTKMSLQFIWEGCDTVLAVPLVVDLIRLVELAHRRGEYGALPQTALFFKQPLGSQNLDLHSQWHLLAEYLNSIKEERG